MKSPVRFFAVRLLCALLLPAAAPAAFAQTGVGINTPTPDVSAALDIVSSSQGLLPPRVAAAAALATPATGLLVYQTGTPAGFYYNAGTPAAPSWQQLNVVGGAGDNLGNHTATTALNLAGQALTGTGASVGTAVGVGVRADGGLNLGQNTAGGNVYLGYLSGAANTVGEGNTFTGTFSGQQNTTGSYNTFAGGGSGQANTTGFHNTFLGALSGFSTTTGSTNTFTGHVSGRLNTTGRRNTFVGAFSGEENTTGTDNAFFGAFSGQNNTMGSANTFAGASSGEDNTTGSANTFTGHVSGLRNTTGSFNTFAGASSGERNTTGNYNTFTGSISGQGNTTGFDNTFTGARSGEVNTTGSSNTFAGAGSGESNTTGSSNTLVGTSSDVSTGALTNATALGTRAVVNASNKVRLGNTLVTVVEGQVAYSFPSDARFKYDVQANVPGLVFIRQLRPVTYRFDAAKLDRFGRTGALPAGCTPNPAAAVQTGFLAQDVEAAARAVGFVFDGVHRPASARDHYSLAYSQFVMPLVRAVQEQQAQIEALQRQNTALQARAAALETAAAHTAADHAALQAVQQQLARLLDPARQAKAVSAEAQARQ